MLSWRAPERPSLQKIIRCCASVLFPNIGNSNNIKTDHDAILEQQKVCCSQIRFCFSFQLKVDARNETNSLLLLVAFLVQAWISLSTKGPTSVDGRYLFLTRTADWQPTSVHILRYLRGHWLVAEARRISVDTKLN